MIKYKVVSECAVSLYEENEENPQL